METIVKEIGIAILGMAAGALIIAIYYGMLRGGLISQAVSNFMAGLTG